MPNPKDTIYAINGSATGFDTTLAANPAAGSLIPVTLGFCRRMEIKETFAAAGAPNPQGLQYQLFDPATQTWGPTIQAAPGETVYVGDVIAEGQGQGRVLGMVKQTAFYPDARGTTSRNADTPIRIISGTVTATLVKVREYQ